jgi:hypothetical protein
MAHTYDEQILSDLHKDARGFRPGEQFWASWDGLCQEVEDSIRQEQQQQARAQAAWEADIQRLIEIGAGDRATAIRWDMEAMDARHGDHFDAGYYCYLRGIGYGLEHEIRRLIAA